MDKVLLSGEAGGSEEFDRVGHSQTCSAMLAATSKDPTKTSSRGVGPSKVRKLDLISETKVASERSYGKERFRLCWRSTGRSQIHATSGVLASPEKNVKLGLSLNPSNTSLQAIYAAESLGLTKNE
jgi:hypothetical protein